MAAFARKLAADMRAHGDSPTDLAKACGVAPTTVDRWLKGALLFHRTALPSIVARYGKPAEFYLDDALDAPPPAEVQPEERPLLAMIREMGVAKAWRRLLLLETPPQASAETPEGQREFTVPAAVEHVPTVGQAAASRPPQPKLGRPARPHSA